MNSSIYFNMKIIIATILTLFVAITHEAIPPRTVNLALETSFLFDPKYLRENLNLINRIRDFLDKLHATLVPQRKGSSKYRRYYDGMRKNGSEMNALNDVFEIGGIQVSMVNAKDTIDSNNTIVVKTGNALDMSNEDTSLDEESKDANTNVKTKGADLEKTLDFSKIAQIPELLDIGRSINEYYTENDIQKMKALLTNFNENTGTKTDLSKVVKELINVAIVDKYKSLNSTCKVTFLTHIRKLMAVLANNTEFSIDQMQNQGLRKDNTKASKEPSEETGEIDNKLDKDGKGKMDEDGGGKIEEDDKKSKEVENDKIDSESGPEDAELDTKPI